MDRIMDRIMDGIMDRIMDGIMDRIMDRIRPLASRASMSGCKLLTPADRDCDTHTPPPEGSKPDH